MQKLFEEVGSLDKRCYEEFDLTEDILMEHAAQGMASYIQNNFAKNSKVTIVCGSGNNGADGIACARLLHGDFDVSIYYAKEPKSQMALLQQKRADAIGVKNTKEIKDSDVLIDAITGTGFNGEFSSELKELIESMNALEAFKIACDVPSGYKFFADVTLTMGALKKNMFLDAFKEFVGKIEVLDLGVTREIYERETNWHLLDFDDLRLPTRELKNTHKGSFGHLALACGTKSGASILSARAALRFGAGLVTLVGYENEQIPHSIMYSHELPYNTTALAIGMGLGDEFSDEELDEFLDSSLPLVADADIFHMPIVTQILKRKNVVLTPHAKEFSALLKQVGLADISVEELQKYRFKYVELFTSVYPNVTLLLKGANVIIAKGKDFFINPHGTSSLAKGGSGDVLSGLIGALLAQGYDSLEAAKNASLAHTRLAQSYSGADFSLTPDDLIMQIGKL
ncbi:NAD(P)H-hydrate dehydratase [Sulfurimonas sp.]|uniref:NAD(P)H-hydrate dehydratase n=1 Tax=Sulfurimonas sp. TaxID=2022749 RepID=UPI00356433AF